MELTEIGEAIEERRELDPLVYLLRGIAGAVLPAGPARRLLQGRAWLGHPVHPALTDLPIGFWTSSFVLDLIGGRRSARASTLLVGAGVLSGLPTAAAGLADWTELDSRAKRSGAVHAAANSAALVLYVLSLLARSRGRRARGVLFGLAGATAATFGGHLGGHLTYRRGSGVRVPNGGSSPDAASVL